MSGVRGRPLISLWALIAACGSEGSPPEPEPEPEPVPELCERNDSLDALPDPASYDYDHTCTGEVAANGAAIPTDPVAEDCTTGIWPDLDDTVDVCPTVSEATRTDPVSGLTLPSADGRPLPTEIPITATRSRALPVRETVP